MLCVTGRETSLEALRERLSSVAARLKPCLQEVRLDALCFLNDALQEVLDPYREQIILCCRAKRQGGYWQGSEAERLAVLARYAAEGAKWVDVESDVDSGLVQELRERSGSHILLSHHGTECSCAELERIVESLARRESEAHKIAVPVQDAAELWHLREVGKRLGREGVVVGMGPAGLLSRVRYTSFRSRWTYVAARQGGETAPGQLSIDSALALGLPESATSPFLALVGGAQVLQSPGPPTYNKLFRRTSSGLSYVPVLTERVADTLSLLRALGALGASITMPHKRAVLESSIPDSIASAAGSANTVRFLQEQTQATNTDVRGVEEPLGRMIDRLRSSGRWSESATALLLGSGGAARAACAACRRLGLAVIVAARHPKKADFASEWAVKVVPWEQRTTVAAQVLIRATPPEPQGPEAWPWEVALGKEIVFDMTLCETSTTLLDRARSEGAATISGEEMWIAQGVEQLPWITQQPVDATELRDCLTWP